MKKTKLICFDVDGTLVDGVSWLLLTKDLGCSTQQHLDIFHQAKDGKISFVEAERLLTKMYIDSGNANKPFIKNLFSKIKLRPGVKKLISYLKEKDYLIYLISGAIDICVEKVAKKLKANGFYANSTLEFDKKDALKKIHYRDNQGEVKVEQLKQLLKKLEIKTNEVIFIGDSENDIEVFKFIGKGIAVYCFNEDLKKVAWKVVDTLPDIKKLL